MFNEIGYSSQNNISLATKNNIVPTSRFNPIAHVKFDTNLNDYAFKTSQENKTQFVQNLQEEAAFIYLTIAIGDWMRYGLGAKGLKELINHNIKKTVNFKNFLWDEIYKDGDAVIIPFIDNKDSTIKKFRFHLTDEKNKKDNNKEELSLLNRLKGVTVELVPSDISGAEAEIVGKPATTTDTKISTEKNITKTALYNFLCLKWLSRNERKIKDPILLYKKMGSKKN
ncbi:hypothetical protein OMAG_000373, partial [Candidatus Omnitrophus magneticus]